MTWKDLWDHEVAIAIPELGSRSSYVFEMLNSATASRMWFMLEVRGPLSPRRLLH